MSLLIRNPEYFGLGFGEAGEEGARAPALPPSGGGVGPDLLVPGIPGGGKPGQGIMLGIPGGRTGKPPGIELHRPSSRFRSLGRGEREWDLVLGLPLGGGTSSTVALSLALFASDLSLILITLVALASALALAICRS